MYSNHAPIPRAPKTSYNPKNSSRITSERPDDARSSYINKRQTRQTTQRPNRIDMNLQFLRNMPSDFKATTAQASWNKSKRSTTSTTSVDQARRAPATASGTQLDLSSSPVTTPQTHGAGFMPRPPREPRTPSATFSFISSVSTVTPAVAAPGRGKKPVGGQLQKSRWAADADACSSDSKSTSKSTRGSIYSQADVLRASAQAGVRAIVSTLDRRNNEVATRNEFTPSLHTTIPSLASQTAVNGISKPLPPDSDIRRGHVHLRRDGRLLGISYKIYLKQGQFRSLQTTRIDTSQLVDIDDEITTATLAKINPHEPKEVIYQANDQMAVWTIIFNMPPDAVAFVRLLLSNIPASQLYLTAQDRERLWPSVQLPNQTSLEKAAEPCPLTVEHVDLLEGTHNNQTLLDSEGPLAADGPDNTARISAGTFTDLIDIQDGHKPLIDLGEAEISELAEVAPTEGRRATMDLALDLSPVEILEAIENREGGFLERVLAVATDVTIQSAIDEILDSDKALQAANRLVLRYFGNSKLFTELLEDAEQVEFSSILSPEILTEAIEARDRAQQQKTIHSLDESKGSAAPREESYFSHTTHIGDVTIIDCSESTGLQQQQVKSVRRNVSKVIQIGLPYDDIISQRTHAYQQDSSTTSSGIFAHLDTHDVSNLNNASVQDRTPELVQARSTGSSQITPARRVHHAVTNSEVDRLGQRLEQRLRISSGEVATINDSEPEDNVGVRSPGIVTAEIAYPVDVNNIVQTTRICEPISVADQKNGRTNSEVSVEPSAGSDAVQNAPAERAKRGLAALAKSKYASDVATPVAFPTNTRAHRLSQTPYGQKQARYSPITALPVMQDPVLREFIAPHPDTGVMIRQVGYEVTHNEAEGPYVPSGNAYAPRAYSVNGHDVLQGTFSPYHIQTGVAGPYAAQRSYRCPAQRLSNTTSGLYD